VLFTLPPPQAHNKRTEKNAILRIISIYS